MIFRGPCQPQPFCDSVNNDGIKTDNLLIIMVLWAMKLYIELIITLLMSGVMINTEWVTSLSDCI